ncbi:hypothetical protein GWK47_001739 [Chionoecetes opilio]|uniref:Uncharacterized protein n=1 Tax=Chionoecetes opilio TaxID=41210 RepID=A0A8J4XSN7_CHIOP|nr:hypothetical protein GWK47_001739 [Chionoecetes opilio]
MVSGPPKSGHRKLRRGGGGDDRGLGKRGEEHRVGRDGWRAGLAARRASQKPTLHTQRCFYCQSLWSPGSNQGRPGSSSSSMSSCLNLRWSMALVKALACCFHGLLQRRDLPSAGPHFLPSLLLKALHLFRSLNAAQVCLDWYLLHSLCIQWTLAKD